MELELLPCPSCRQAVLVEIPPCVDEHGGDCPDRACTVCGAGLCVGGPATVDLRVAVWPTSTPRIASAPLVTSAA